MKTIAVGKQSRSLRELLAKAQKENLILRSPNGTEFILAEINDFDREIERQRGNQSLMAFLEQRGGESATLSATQVRRKLGLAKG